jgi:hypothetical protein
MSCLDARPLVSLHVGLLREHFVAVGAPELLDLQVDQQMSFYIADLSEGLVATLHFASVVSSDFSIARVAHFVPRVQLLYFVIVVDLLGQPGCLSVMFTLNVAERIV